ncbi:MAG: DUF3037 domain-containing protein [Bacteroidales bacterium]|nr:DUF3037 domain-containing protein [Bacteroidales bacterium]
MMEDMNEKSRQECPPDYNLYEYAVIRYVPVVERGEFINIGLIMMCKRRRWLKCEICVDEKRINSFCRHADVEMLRRQAALFMRRDVPQRDLPVEETYRWLTAVKSAMLQTSPSHPGIAVESLDDTFRRLFLELVE